MFNLMNAHKFEINSVPGTTPGTYLNIAKGIKSVSPKSDEKLVQDQYLDGDGFADTDVTSTQLILSFQGDRDYDDEAQNYIMGLLLEIGNARRTQFKWTEPDLGVIAGECTIASIEGPGGDAGAKGEIKFEIHFNGKPNYTPAP
jgi:hypothetical protein